jgi:hypothetical protein
MILREAQLKAEAERWKNDYTVSNALYQLTTKQRDLAREQLASALERVELLARRVEEQDRAFARGAEKMRVAIADAYDSAVSGAGTLARFVETPRDDE